jgi:hypothetical protein
VAVGGRPQDAGGLGHIPLDGKRRATDFLLASSSSLMFRFFDSTGLSRLIAGICKSETVGEFLR